jgi:hypothetical protein
MVPTVPTVLAQTLHALGNVVVARYNRASVAERTQVLCRVEAECRHIRKGTSTRAIANRPVRLGAVLYDQNSVRPYVSDDSLNVGKLTIEMRYDDGTRRGRERFEHCTNIYFMRRFFDIDVDRSRTHLEACGACVHAGVGYRDDFVPDSATRRAQTELEGIRSVSDTDAVRYPTVLRELSLESRMLRPVHVPAAVKNARQRCVDAGPYDLGLPTKSVEWYVHPKPFVFARATTPRRARMGWPPMSVSDSRRHIAF